MPSGGNATWVKMLADKKDTAGMSSALVKYIPNDVWIAARVRALQSDMKINSVLVRLITKYSRGEVDP